MPDSNTRYYAVGAFVLGVGLTTLLSTQRSHQNTGKEPSKRKLKQHRKQLLAISKIKDEDLLRKALLELEESLDTRGADIKQGIEGCIGDTPLIRIKSLSEATGCEILAKAEVMETILTYF